MTKGGILRLHRKFGLLVGFASAVLAIGVTSAAGGSAAPKAQPIDHAQLKALTATSRVAPRSCRRPGPSRTGGADPRPGNGVTYGYNMVGADPNNCSGAACDVTVEADITPIIVNVDGLTFSGSDVLAATLASPQFATNDYGSTPSATAAGASRIRRRSSRARAARSPRVTPATSCSSRTRRCAPSSTRPAQQLPRPLHTNMLPAFTINVPTNQGILLQSGRGVIFADVSISWWASQIKNLEQQRRPDPPAGLPDQRVLLHIGRIPLNCCVIGFHGAHATGNGTGYGNSNGNAPMQTFAWASWVQPGIYARPDGGTDWALQDIHALSHEISEWADDPFVNNTVEPWLTPTAPQYGCTGILETGDPVVGIGFAMGTNTFQQGAKPRRHAERRRVLPPGGRGVPAVVHAHGAEHRLRADPVGRRPNVGRYTLMGDLNPFPGFRSPPPAAKPRTGGGRGKRDPSSPAAHAPRRERLGRNGRGA